MAWRIGKGIVRGEMDNRTQGLVTGSLWVLGREEPIRFKLEGNCHRDIAGCRLEFENVQPAMEPDALALYALQKGVVGDITGSRRVRVEPGQAAGRGREVAVPPHGIANVLSIEWISAANGRVVIEGHDFRLRVTHMEWRMTAEQEARQVEANFRSLHDWLDGMAETPDVADLLEDDDTPMDEFEWEHFLKEADMRAEKYMLLCHKYKDHPDCERLIARDMGWTWSQETGEPEFEAEGESEDEPADGSGAWAAETDWGEDTLEPNPMTEGVDWVRSDDGHVEHPLTVRMHEIAVRMWQHCKGRGLLDSPGDADLQDLVAELQTTSAKVAGALDGLAYDEQPEGGFVVACLKRALVHLHNAIAATAKVAHRNILDRETIAAFRRSIFAVREDILRLMNRYRSEAF